jgi:hypothetical protein
MDKLSLREKIAEILSFAIYEINYDRLTVFGQQDVSVNTDKILALLPPKPEMSEEEIKEIINITIANIAVGNKSNGLVNELASALASRIGKPAEEECMCGAVATEHCPVHGISGTLQTGEKPKEYCNVTRQKCIAHFKGVDHLGTCNTGCQWYREDSLCPNGFPYPTPPAIEPLTIGYTDVASKVQALNEKVNELIDRINHLTQSGKER